MQKRETTKKRELSKYVRNDSININFILQHFVVT